MTLGDWTPREIAGASGAQSIDEVAATGANVCVFLVTAYQATSTSSGLDSPRPPTPELDAFEAAAARASARDLDVVLKLHVDVDDGTWRGLIRPANPESWFDAYRAFVEDCASAAASARATTLVVGTELAGTIDHEARWRDVVAAARARFGGEIVYAASWDEAERVPFWDAVDAVGVNFYFPVAQRRDAGRLELLAGWQPWLDRLQSLSRRTSRAVILTEVGYRSVDGAGMDPALWTTTPRVDVAEQADLYWAALTAVEGAPFIRGLWWWTYEVGAVGGPDDAGYTPRGKPALTLLANAWGGPS
ncbi:MAG: hypothetical protein U0167_09215 [bacterium]